MRSEGPITVVMRKEKFNLRTGAREPRAGPGRCRLAPGPGCLCPGPAQCSRPWKQGPWPQVWASASEQLGEGEGEGLGLLQGYPGPLAHCFPVSLSRESRTGGSWSKLLTAQITDLFPTQGTKLGPALSVWRASPAARPAAPPAHPPARRPSCCGPRALALTAAWFLPPACSLTRTSLLPDAHFPRRLLEGPVSDTPATDDCRFAGAGMVGRCRCS